MREAARTPAPHAIAPSDPQISTRSALLFVYISYTARYLQLLILIPYLGRVLGPAEYGKVLTAMSLFNVVWMVVQYGFGQVGLRDVINAKSPRDVARHFGSQIQARLISSAVGILIGAAGIYASPLLRSDPAYGAAAVALGVASAFNLGWFFQAVQRFRTSVLLEVAGFAMTVILTLAWVRDAGDGLFVLLSLLVSCAITLTAGYVLALRSLEWRSIRLARATSLIAASGSMFVSTGVPIVMTSASSYLLALFADAQEVGYFGAAERLATVVLSLMAPAGQVLTATVSRRLIDPDTRVGAYVLIRTAVALMVGFGVLATLGAWTLSGYLIPMIFGPGYEGSVHILQILALTFPLAAFSQSVRLYVLFPLGHDRSLMLSAVVGAALNVAAILVLARDHGGPGVAAARVLAEFFIAAMLVFALARTSTAGEIFGTYLRKLGLR